MAALLQKIRLRVLYVYGTLLILALLTVLAFGPALVARRYGYTWSLLIWIVPDIAILWWFLSSKAYSISKKKAFGWTIFYLFLNGVILDFFFAHNLFTFPNKSAVVGFYLPGFNVTEFRFVWEKPFPIEELFFYFFGLVCILMVYIWGDEYWLENYQQESFEIKGSTLKAITGFHLKALLLGIGLLLFGTLLKLFLNPTPEYRIPLYLAIQIFMAFVPTVILLKAVGRQINWRAFSFTLVTALLISLLYEVTLGVPGRWWGYQQEPMVGLFIASWHDLPIESITLWYAAVFMTILVYEAFKVVKSNLHYQ